MSGDWQCGKSLAECNQYMLDHEINTDVTFIIPNKDDEDNTGSDTVHCKAHRFMLVSRSPVFYAMLCGTLAEQGDIRVEDANPEAFNELLKYIYTDNIAFLPSNVFDILYLSNKYIIPRLTSKCIEYLYRILNPDNVCLILDHSLIYENEKLIEHCLECIKLRTHTALKSDTILDIRNETLMKILDCEVLLMKEVDVFNACVRWATHQLELKQVEATGENIRNILGDCIYKIGYGYMDNKDFQSVVIPSGVLNVKEESAFYRYMDNTQLNSPPENFICKRKGNNFSLQFLSFAQHIETEIIADVVVKVTLTCATDIQITSLFIGTCPGKTKIQSIHIDKHEFRVENKTTIACHTQEWELYYGLFLREGQQYVLEFEFHNEEDDTGEKPVYVLKTSELTIDQETVKLKMQSNCSFLPLLGFRCTPLSILK